MTELCRSAINTIRRRGRGPDVVDMKKVAFLIIGSSLFLTISCAQEGTGSSSSLNEEESSGISQPTVSSEEAVEEETLVLNVQIPTALEEGANLSIGSTLNSWDPSDEDYFASKVDDTHYRLTLSFPEERLPLEIEYKWTIQLPSFGAEDIWLGVEKASDGVSEIENRVVTLTPTASGTTEVNDVVAAFRDPHAAEQPTVVGNLDIFDVDAPELGAGLKRTVRVYTPSDYETSGKSYPVIYMQDGQNLFDQATSFAGEWQIDETMEERLAAGLETAIVVGIDNTADRMDEYTPPWEDAQDAKGDDYVRFVKGSLKTYIDDNYRTLEDAANTMIGGSSMGGLISFYAGMKYPETFGGVLALSPSFQINTTEARNGFLASLYNDKMPRLFLAAGTEEPLEPYLDAVSMELYTMGFPVADNLYVYENEGASHNEANWRAVFPEAYAWVRSSEGGNYDPTRASAKATVKMSEEAASYLASLEAEGTLYLYNGQLATSPVLEKVGETTYEAELSGRIDTEETYYVLYYEDGVIETFGLDAQGAEASHTHLFKEDGESFVLDVASFEKKELLDYTINMPENIVTYFSSFSDGAQFILYTGSLASSLYPSKVNDRVYKVHTYLEPGASVAFQFLYFDNGSGLEAYEIDEEGHLVQDPHVIELGTSGKTELSYDLAGFQLPVNLTVEVTIQDDFEIPTEGAFLPGLYNGIFGSSYRDSPMTLKEGRTYSLVTTAYSGLVYFTFGYCTGPEEGSYDNQVFERKDDGSLVTVYEEIAIPFSEFDPANIPSYTIEYTTTYLA